MKKVSIEQKRYILNDVFKVEEAYLRLEQFNGEMSQLVRGLNLEREDSVSVLVFNQTTEKLILVGKFRYATYPKTDGWTIESIAEMIDAGETPEQSAKRVVQEETGLKIDTFERSKS